MDWRQLQPLLLHFATTHEDLEVTWEKQGGLTTKTGHVQINISIDRAKFNTFGLKVRLEPGETKFEQFKCTEFPQYDKLPKNLNLNYARKKRNLAKRKVVLSSDGRAQKYRSQTLEPIPTNQLDYDSEEDENIDRTWMKEDNEKVRRKSILLPYLVTPKINAISRRESTILPIFTKANESS